MTRWLLLFLALWSACAGAQTAPNPLEPIAHWVGGEWVTTVEVAPGRQIKVIRRYEWSFDRRLMIGRSFGEAPDGRRRQTRETVFVWNAEAKRIEFSDHIDTGGHGLGFVEARDGGLYMEVPRMVGGSHPTWRAWLKEAGDEQQLRVEALIDGAWKEYGNFPYKRVR
jgi:hypothetical protein